MMRHTEGKFSSLKAEIKRSFGNPSEDPRVSQRLCLLVDKVQARYGVRKAEAVRRVDAWLGALGSVSPKKL